MPSGACDFMLSFPPCRKKWREKNRQNETNTNMLYRENSYDEVDNCGQIRTTHSSRVYYAELPVEGVGETGNYNKNSSTQAL